VAATLWLLRPPANIPESVLFVDARHMTLPDCRAAGRGEGAGRLFMVAWLMAFPRGRPSVPGPPWGQGCRTGRSVASGYVHGR
jgi:hypothetical protein